MAATRSGTSDPAGLPAVSGAYALLIRLARAVELPDRCADNRLPAGRYVYFGSARGGGGIRARCRRHLAAEKKIHWHVDRLTVGARPGGVRAVAFPGLSECELVRRLLAAGELASPVSGFGNTDCRVCPAHLFSVSGPVSWQHVVEALEREEQA